MQKTLVLLFTFSILNFTCTAQTIQDDFEGNGNITTWFGDDCDIVLNVNNPYKQGVNTTAKVLEYKDNGGLYANLRLDAAAKFNMNSHALFSLKIYVPSAAITGSQNNQISLKLQDGSIGAPWSTQCEIVKTIIPDKWQVVTFDFANDPYQNLDGNSLPPTQRSDFNRVVVQLNGENNNDKVIAYIDDFYHQDSVFASAVFDKLVWSDEFDGNGSIDETKWFHQTKLPIGGGWYNGEVQHYTDEDSNSYVSDGLLHIIARKESYTDQNVTKEYTSARLNSKFAFTNGRVEVRAKLPSGVGTWPAIWTLGKNIQETGAFWDLEGYGTKPWPACGEIDIMEHWGDNQNYVSSATHTPSSFGNTVNVAGKVVLTASSDFHVYALEWTAEKLVFSVDSITHFVYNPEVKNAETWPFTTDQYILLNVAIQPSIYNGFTKAAMDVDYVRVYEQSTTSASERAATYTPSFYPNPVASDLTIKVDFDASEPVGVHIHSLDGKMVSLESIVVFNNQLKVADIGYLAPGMYLLQFSHNDKNYNLKFLKR